MNMLVMGLYVEGPTDNRFLPVIIQRTAEYILRQYDRDEVTVIEPIVIKKHSDISHLIARAILKDAPLLIFDEVTANLDTRTERAVIDAIHHVMQGRTTLMITHRLVGLEQADEILVLESGRIKERGTEHDLLQCEGLYWQLWQIQQQTLVAQV